ncbi:MAG: Fe-S cluster assembly protein SufD [Puniceicoccaceae bacterium]|nr:MAG: Fe-S cluster assembly protein SufD [Puniceicoccaceae bacterium]
MSSTLQAPATGATPASLEAAFARHLEECRQLPDWWLEMKRSAFERYRSLPMPSRKDQSWRFSRLRGLELDRFDFNSTTPAADHAGLIARSNLVSRTAGSMVFSDDRLIHNQPVAAELAAQGVVWEPIADALQQHRELLQEYFMAQDPRLGSEKFAALHTAFVNAGCLLYIPKGVEVELPFIAYHWASVAGGTVLPHTLVIAEESARLTLVDAFFAADRSAPHFACGFNHIFAGDNAEVQYYSLQDWSRRAVGFQINSLVTGRDARIKSLGINTGCSHFRGEHQSLLQGAGSHVDMFSLSVASGEQEMDQRTLQRHLAPNATSDLLFKNALSDASRTIFSGLIEVAEAAQQTDAYQTNRNLLLSPEAEANSLPGLEIHANDVKCSHGATTGQIDESEMFYMLSRGIPLNKARELLVFGFFEEVIGNIDEDEMADNVRALIERKFHEDASAQ